MWTVPLRDSLWLVLIACFQFYTVFLIQISKQLFCIRTPTTATQKHFTHPQIPWHSSIGKTIELVPSLLWRERGLSDLIPALPVSINYGHQPLSGSKNKKDIFLQVEKSSLKLFWCFPSFLWMTWVKKQAQSCYLEWTKQVSEFDRPVI